MLLKAKCIISLPSVNSNWSYGPEKPKLGQISFDLYDFELWPLTLTFRMDISFVHVNNSWKFHDDTMMGMIRWWEHSEKCGRQTDGQTDRQMDWTIHRAAWLQLKILSGHLTNKIYNFTIYVQKRKYSLPVASSIQVWFAVTNVSRLYSQLSRLYAMQSCFFLVL